MYKIKVFENREFGQIRTMVIDDEPWFVGKDIAEALGYKRPSDAIASHVYEGDKLKRCFTVSGQGRNMVVINESGMYALIFGSKLDSAIRFKNWVTSEVLPSIRKYGGYFTGQEKMNDKELLAKGYLVALKQIEARTEELEDLIPKGEFFDKFIDLGDCICLRDTAKELGVSTATVSLVLNGKDKKDLEIAKSVKIFFPAQETTGTHMNISGAGVTNFAKNKENAVKLIEFLSSEEAQATFAEGNQAAK